MRLFYPKFPLSFIVLFTIAVLFSDLAFCQNDKLENATSIKSNLLQVIDTPPVAKPDTTIKRGGDRDNDGILDSLDKCPDVKGVIQYDGCPMPDNDNDGLTDDLDECPSVYGSIKYKGCPAGDKDGDKINDDEDKCPEVPGLARFDGCITKDTDGDGINDDDDKCIDVPGTAKNLGCPDTKQYRKILKKQDGKKKSAGVASKNKT